MFLFITFLNGFDQSLPPYKVKILFDDVFILSFYLFIYLFVYYLCIYLLSPLSQFKEKCENTASTFNTYTNLWVVFLG